MQTEPNAKQQIVERIKSTTNILVTVSSNPSVDELSAALGLTLMLNKLDKHATAVFSGAVPPAIDFLEPGKTFENTVDSLRDFIIALDKEKADRLRYKVEENVVRIFITPYKTTITDKDLNFSQGDFNVELIIALGVEKREDIDTAVTAHGRILHDATVVTINAKSEKSSVGSIDWSDGGASSLCEMLMSLSEALQSGILDQQMSTALLTGIVAATDRFRNERTSPKVMTMAAQLMAAGANQQLIATKLEEGHQLVAPAAPTLNDGSTKLEEGASEKLDKQPEEEPAPQQKPDGEMSIDHAPADEVATPEAPTPAEPSVETTQVEAAIDAALAPAQSDGMPSMSPPLSIDELKRDLEAANQAANAAPDSSIGDVKSNGSWRDRPIASPTFGGTLNATADEAEEAKRREDESDQNHMLLSHDDSTSTPPPVFDRPVSETLAPEPTPAPVEQPEPIVSEPDSHLSYEATPEPHENEGQTLAEIEAQAHATATQGVDDARAAVDAALSALPFDPAREPMQSVGAQPLGEEIHPSAPLDTPAPSPQPTPAEPYVPAPQPVEPTYAAPPPLPPLPDFSTLPPLPGEQPPHPAMDDPTLSQDTVAPVPNDPGQFKLPGQQ